MSHNISRLRSRNRSDVAFSMDDYDAVELHDISYASRRDIETTGANNSAPPTASASYQQPQFGEPADAATAASPGPGRTQSPHDSQKGQTALPSLFKYTSVVFENTGSAARDHLANERTFLAWTRTSAIFITLAITFTQFVHITSSISSVTIDNKTYDLSHFTAVNQWPLIHYGKAVEIMGFVLGIIALVMGALRFFHVQTLLTRDYFPATRVPVFILVAINIAMLVLLLVLDIKISR